MRLIDADALLEKVREIRKLALDRAVETPANMPFPIYQNPAYTRYSTQADEREKFKVMIEEAPSVQPETNCSEIPNNWIPCSERLPDDLAEVNVTWVNHNPEPYYDFVKNKPCTGSAVYYKGDWYWYSSVCVDVLAEYGKNEIDEIDDAIEITAWMPLPEPYQEGGERS